MREQDLFPNFVVGTTIACVVTTIAGSMLSRSITSGLLFAACHLAACVVGGPLVMARIGFSRVTSREAFLMPFFPIVISPLLLGVVAVVYDWKVDEPVVRYLGVGVCSATAVVALLGFFKLCDVRSDR